MITEYVNKLIENIPNNSKQKQLIDLVLDGGMFNGSYLVGALYFLKEMEKREYIEIKRISGCSIGSVVAFFYYTNSLDLVPKLYEIFNDEFKTKHTLNSIKNLKEILKERIPDNICSIVNDKLFICYNNIKKQKKLLNQDIKMLKR